MAKIGILHSGTRAKVQDYVERFKAAVATHVIGGAPIFDDDATHNYGHNGKQSLNGIAQRLINDGAIDLVAALGGSAAMRAAIRANNPNRKQIVVCCPSDGLIAAHNRSYSTGVHAKTSSLESRRLTLLLDAIRAQPGDTIGVLLRQDREGNDVVRNALDIVVTNWNMSHQPSNPLTLDYREVLPAANDAVTIADITRHFQSWRAQVRGALVTSDPLFHDIRADIVSIANANVRKTIYQWGDFVTAGGWMSHGANLLSCYDSAGHMCGRIIAGETAQGIPPVTEDAITEYHPNWPH